MIKSKTLRFTCLPVLLTIAVTFTFMGCAIQKTNKDKGKFFLNFGTKYNILYNGNSLLDQGKSTIDEAVHDNYQQTLSVFKEPNESSIQQNKELMDSLINKATRIIQEKGESKYIDDAYMLKGKASYYQGNYYNANEFFNYVLKNVQKDLRTTQEAFIWQANSLLQLDNKTEAIKVLDQAFANSESEDHFNGLLYAVQAKYYLKENDKNSAIDMLSKAIEYDHHKKTKLRWNYILGQLLFEKGENEKAYSHFSKVVKSNESYEMSFFANLYRVEILNKNNPGIQTRVGLLAKLLKDSKNKDYKGQIYQRIGDAYLADQQIDMAIQQYKLAIQNSQNNNFQQTINYLRIADLFFDQGSYTKASLYYDSTMQVLTEDNLKYEQIKRKTANLGALVGQLTIISYQDTLLDLAALPPTERETAIDSIIEKRALLAQTAPDKNNQASSKTILLNNDNLNIRNERSTQTFYFSNSSAISQGYSVFKQRWGNRSLADNWRYSNKAIMEITSISNDSSSQDTTNRQEGLEEQKEIWRNRYLQDIPDNDEKLAIVNKNIVQAYLSLAEIYENALNDEVEAANTYEVLLKRFPDLETADLVYYHLYRLYVDRIPQKSTLYREKLLTGFPNSKYAKVINDPDYYKNQRNQLQEFNEEYSMIYGLFSEKKYLEVIRSTEEIINEQTYEELGNTAQLAYLQALAIGRTSNIESFKTALLKIIDKYPEEELVVPLVKQHLAYIDEHPDQFINRITALEDIDQNRTRFIDEPVITPWPELVYDRQYKIPQNRKDYNNISSITSITIGEQQQKTPEITNKQLKIGIIQENGHENSYRNLDLLPEQANYYFVINVMYGSINLSPSRYGIGQFNRGQYQNATIRHQLKNVADENQLIYIGVFSTYEEAKSYETAIQPLLNKIMKIPEDIYNSFIITEDNFNTLTDFDKINDYYTTYIQQP